MASNNFNMSFDPQVRQQFAEIVEGYGLTVPQAFKLMANQVIRTKVLPISFDWQAQTQPEFELTDKAKAHLAQTTKEFDNGDFETIHSVEEFMQMAKGLVK